MPPTPRRRAYAPTKGDGKGAGDLSETLRFWGGLMVGYGVGATWGMILLGGILPGLLIAGPVGAVFAYFMLRAWMGTAVGLVGGALNPSGKSTAYKRQYSDAEAAAVRGDFDAALTAYARYVMEDPSDPEPYFRVARIHRNERGDFEQAAHWYRRVRREATLHQGQELQATRELVELYVHKLKQPRKAIPELARLVERFPGTPPARAAEDELARLRQLMADEGEDGESLTGRFYKDH